MLQEIDRELEVFCWNFSCSAWTEMTYFEQRGYLLDMLLRAVKRAGTPILASPAVEAISDKLRNRGWDLKLSSFERKQ